MRENLYELLKKIIQHPEKKEILEELLAKEIRHKSFLQNIFGERMKI
jgi:rubrerythrin